MSKKTTKIMVNFPKIKPLLKPLREIKKDAKELEEAYKINENGKRKR